jgi:BASS family bile acid:Na+ symporter
MLAAAARFLIRHAALALALGVVAGLALPKAAAALHPFLPELVMVALTSTLLRLDHRLLVANLRRPRLLAGVAAWLLLGIPSLTLIACHLLPFLPPMGPEMARALLLNAATPPIMGSPAMALILGLDAELAAVATLGLTLLFPITLTAWFASGLLPTAGDIAPATIFGVVAGMVAIPFVVSVLFRTVVPVHRRSSWPPLLDATGVLALTATATALMHGANQILAADLGASIAPLLASLTFNVACQGTSIILFRRRGTARALCLGLMSGDRNLALTLGATAAIGSPWFAAYVAFAQLPIYFTPMALARLSSLAWLRCGETPNATPFQETIDERTHACRGAADFHERQDPVSDGGQNGRKLRKRDETVRRSRKH